MSEKSRHGSINGSEIVQAIQNLGTWPPVLKFLDDTGLSVVPLFGRPPIVRDRDGTLRIIETEERVPVGDWLTLTRNGKLHHMPDEEFQAIRWDTK